MALNPDSDEKINSEHLNEAKQALGRLMRYLDKNEQEAAEQLYKIAQDFEGRNAREALKMLDDKKLYNEVVKIVSKVESLKKKVSRISSVYISPLGIHARGISPYFCLVHHIVMV